MILATEADRPAIEAFLTAHIATAMFPLSNLRRHGMAGGHPRALNFWLKWQAGAISDVLTISEEGVLFPNCPTAPWAEARVILAGTSVKGLLGDGAQVAALRQTLSLTSPAGLDTVEPLYRLPLADLQHPDLDSFSLRPLAAAPEGLAVAWRCAYLEEVLPMPGEDTRMTATNDIASYIKADSHRMLFRGDDPVAMTGFNAVLPEAVQIGGVYTPPDLRGCGLARRAVAMHLLQARESGVAQAILFAASTAAARAYEAIGFSRIGDFTIAMYENPQVIHV
ncbi:GNAT family N-acetyltransferase [Yoonia sp. BS5-3]|uniref:GNAT family N-acetyltransferase n=1 Tax=Yoonia phaeophyticola TaxID=3137369 RepID=A0ABZ2V669_9RHOB